MWWTVIPALLDKLLPDATAAQDAKIKLMELAQAGELAVMQADVELAKGQMAVNAVEASGDWFRAGWRPAVGWVCVAGLGYQLLLMPLLPWVLSVCGVTAPPLPPIDGDSLMTLLLGLLGLGGLRSYEKVKGISSLGIRR